MSDLSWNWILLMLAVPPPVACLVAWPVWRRNQIILGNLAGSAVIFASAIALIMREYVELDRVTRGCLDAGFTCWPTPGFFARFAIYAGLGLIEVFTLFGISLRVERQIRNRRYAPEWR